MQFSATVQAEWGWNHGDICGKEVNLEINLILNGFVGISYEGMVENLSTADVGTLEQGSY